MIEETSPATAKRSVAILVFDEVEELDFVGPLEVFGVTNRLKPDSMPTFTIGTSGREMQGVNGLTVKPLYSFQTGPGFNILVVPGGKGARREMKNPETLAFVKQAARNCELVASVCTGSLILAAAGLLDGKRATTHWAALEELRQFSKVHVDHQRFIREGRIITSSGISAGIDMALHIVKELQGSEVSKDVAHRMEYRSDCVVETQNL